jgi:hypothetical protein
MKRHASSGRYQVFVIELEARSLQLFVKFAPDRSLMEWQLQRETIKFLADLFPDMPKVLIAPVEEPLIAFEYLPHAASLASLADDLALLHLQRLSLPISRLHALADFPNAKSFFALSNSPMLSPIWLREWAQASPAARVFTQRLQGSKPLHDACTRARAIRSPAGFIHGDIKLDNILIDHGNLFLIDFETAGLGGIARDISAVLGSMLWLWLKTVRIDSDGMISEFDESLHNVRLADVQHAAELFLTSYFDESKGSPLYERQISDTLAEWLVGRGYAQCSYQLTPPASSWLMLQLAHNIALGLFPFVMP